MFLPVVQDENVFKFTKEREKEMLRGVSRIFNQGQILFSGWGGQKYFHYGQNRAQRGADNFLPPPLINSTPWAKQRGGGQKIFFITLPLCPPGELFSSGAET